MKQLIWGKTLLTSYRFFERVVGAIDKLVMKEAMGSISSSALTYSMKSAESISSKILDYTDKKVALINAKVLVEKALYSMDKSQAKFLIKKYLELKRPKEIISETMCPRRTYYRRMESAEKTFANKILMMGFNDEKLDGMLSNQKWLMKIYSQIEIESIDYKQENLALNSDYDLIFLQNAYKTNRVSLFG